MALVKGVKANLPKNFLKNVKTMQKAGYSKKRAVGAAYGEADLGIDKHKRIMRKLKNDRLVVDANRDHMIKEMRRRMRKNAIDTMHVKKGK